MRLRIPLFVKIAVPLAVMIILVMGAAVFRSADPPGVIRQAREIFGRPVRT